MNETVEYLEQAKLLHKRPKAWPGKTLVKYIKWINRIIDEKDIKTILNYGSGKAQFVPSTWDCINYDPAVMEFEEKPTILFDLVVCTDVMEHIPEESTDLVLKEIFSFAEKWVFLTISCRPAGQLLPNGKNAHCLVKPPDWWDKKLQPFKNFTRNYAE